MVKKPNVAKPRAHAKTRAHASTREHDCVCDIKLQHDEVTSDSELPLASGGVAASQVHEGPEAKDGCDLDFRVADATRDEDLPITVGGVR